MIVTYFSSAPDNRQNVIAYGLSQRAFPIETRTPEQLSRLVRKIGRR